MHIWEQEAPAFFGTNLKVLGVSDPCDQNETYRTSNEDKIEHMNESCQVDEQPFKIGPPVPGNQFPIEIDHLKMPRLKLQCAVIVNSLTLQLQRQDTRDFLAFFLE